MCGRFTIISDQVTYQMEFDVSLDENLKHTWKSRYNVSPTQPVPVVSNPNERTVELMQWGLIPAWAKGDKKSTRLINIRSETLTEKVTFRQLFQRGQRCMILADGFFEWQIPDDKKSAKIPYYFYLQNHKPLAFAGLWSVSRLPDGNPVNTCAIITCAPNELVGAIHNRMPVILDPASAWEWVSQAPGTQALALLRPCPQSEMACHQVSSLVNNPVVDAPECILPAAQ